MTKKIGDIYTSAMVQTLVSFDKKNELETIFKTAEAFDNALLIEGLHFFREELLSNGVDPWSVSNLVNDSHINGLKQTLLLMSNFIHEKALLYKTNHLETLLADQIIEYLKSERRDCDEQVVKLLLNYNDLCAKVFDKKNPAVVLHPLFQDPLFIFKRTRELKPKSWEKIVLSTARGSTERQQLMHDSTMESVSLMHYLVRSETWLNTETGKSRSTHAQNYWTKTDKNSSGSSEFIEANSLSRAARVNIGVFLNRKDEIEDVDAYRKSIVNQITANPALLSVLRDLPVDDTTSAYDLSFVLDPAITKASNPSTNNPNNIALNFACSLHAFTHGYEQGVSPFLWTKVNLGYVPVKYLEPFANMKYFNGTLRQVLSSLDPNSGNDVRKSFAVATTCSGLATIWDKPSGFAMAKEAKDMLGKKLRIYVSNRSDVSLDQICDFVSSGLGVDDALREDISRLVSEFHFSKAISHNEQQSNTDEFKPY